jgi:hypothetical protein
MKALALFVLRATSALSSNVTHVWGRITAVTQNGFQVDQNFNADPQSAYRRGKRNITFKSATKFQGRLPQDLRVGRTVDIVGVATRTGVPATRVIVYEGNRPVHITAGARVTATNGSTRWPRSLEALLICKIQSHITIFLPAPESPTKTSGVTCCSMVSRASGLPGQLRVDRIRQRLPQQRRNASCWKFCVPVSCPANVGSPGVRPPPATPQYRRTDWQLALITRTLTSEMTAPVGESVRKE